MTTSEIRVRIAPSPSGYLHVGTARTAIFNYLYARHFGGKFLIRIEDTDAERSDQSLVKPIIDALKWLGIESDEPTVYQSARKEIYADFARKILSSGHGYRCFCTPAELEAERAKSIAEKKPHRYSRKCLELSENEIQDRIAGGLTFAIRLKIPNGVTAYNDMVSGEIQRQNVEIEDFIIARSDTTATYNLAVVVDDHEMNISHVIRGNDHITNTFKQIHIYRAFEWKIPEFGHVPLLLRPDKKKVSKRLGDKDIAEYASEGILPEAMFNYLSLLGWSPKTEKEIYTPDELIKMFDPAHFNASNAVFDEEKLIAFNKQHIMMKNSREILEFIKNLDETKLQEHFVAAEKINLTDILMTLHAIKEDNDQSSERSARIVDSLKERVRTLLDFATLG
ncbi:MAG: glutamate--tRNA ligase, partial [Candidatus Zixiibacteriota bacterium]